MRDTVACVREPRKIAQGQKALFMLRRILLVVLTASLPLALLHWSEHPHHDVPRWLLLVSALPFFWVSMSDDEYWDDDDSALATFFSRFAIVYTFGASAFLIVIGVMGLSLKSGWGDLVAYALPFGAVGLVLAIGRVWLRRH